MIWGHRNMPARILGLTNPMRTMDFSGLKVAYVLIQGTIYIFAKFQTN